MGPVPKQGDLIYKREPRCSCKVPISTKGSKFKSWWRVSMGCYHISKNAWGGGIGLGAGALSIYVEQGRGDRKVTGIRN